MYRSFFAAKKDIHWKREVDISILVKNALEAKEPFTDPSFPPEMISIYRDDNTDLDEEEIEHYKKLKWERLSKVYPE